MGRNWVCFRTFDFRISMNFEIQDLSASILPLAAHSRWRFRVVCICTNFFLSFCYFARNGTKCNVTTKQLEKSCLCMPYLLSSIKWKHVVVIQLGHPKYIILHKLYVCKLAYSKNLHLCIHIMIIIFVNNWNVHFQHYRYFGNNSYNCRR